MHACCSCRVISKVSGAVRIVFFLLVGYWGMMIMMCLVRFCVVKNVTTLCLLVRCASYRVRFIRRIGVVEDVLTLGGHVGAEGPQGHFKAQYP